MPKVPTFTWDQLPQSYAGSWSTSRASFGPLYDEAYEKELLQTFPSQYLSLDTADRVLLPIISLPEVALPNWFLSLNTHNDTRMSPPSAFLAPETVREFETREPRRFNLELWHLENGARLLVFGMHDSMSTWSND